MNKAGGNDMIKGGALVKLAADGAYRGPLAFEPDRYRGELEANNELTEEQANAILFELWKIMQAFVSLGWGVDSIHFVLPELATRTSEGEPDGMNIKFVDQFETASSEMESKE